MFAHSLILLFLLYLTRYKATMYMSQIIMRQIANTKLMSLATVTLKIVPRRDLSKRFWMCHRWISNYSNTHTQVAIVSLLKWSVLKPTPFTLPKNINIYLTVHKREKLGREIVHGLKFPCLTHDWPPFDSQYHILSQEHCHKWSLRISGAAQFSTPKKGKICGQIPNIILSF